MKRLYILFLVVLVKSYLFGIDLNFNFEQINNKKGLPSNEIRRVFQDKEGFMWFGSIDGLIRYDGYEFKTYRNSIETPELMTSNAITAISDDDNYVWIGTSKGLNKWNKHFRKIEKVHLDVIDNVQINKILITGSDYIWLATSKGLFKYFPEKNIFEGFFNSSSQNSLPSNDVKDGIVDSKGRLWLALWNNGVVRFNPTNNTFIQFPKINETNSAHYIFEDKSGNFWIGSWGYGLYKMINPETPTMTSYVRFSNINIPGCLNSDIIYSITQDVKYGYIWVGHRNGLSVLTDPNDPCSFINYSSTLAGFGKNFLYDVNSVYVDFSGIIWLGMLGNGVEKININSTKLRKIQGSMDSGKLTSTSITAIWNDNERYIWVGMKNNGLYIYDLKTEKFIDISYIYKKGDVKLTDYITGITYIKRFNEIWLTVKVNKIVRIQLNGSKLPSGTSLVDPTITKYDRVNRVFEDVDNNIWILTRSDLNIWTKNNKIVRLDDPNTNVNGDFEGQCIIQEKNKNIWVGTSQHGLFSFKLQKDKLKLINAYNNVNKINNLNILSILIDKKNTVWVGTQGGGVNSLNRATNKFENLNKKLNIPYDILFNMFEDKKGNIWAMNENAILKLDYSLKKQFIVYNVSDNIWNNTFNQNCPISKFNDHMYLLGGANGFNILDVNQVLTSNYMPKLVITDFKVGNLSVFSNDFENHYNSSSQYFELKNNENNFNIEFAALSYSNPEKIFYAYRLKGFDDKWINVDARKRIAGFTNIPKGKYIFEVKATNENGIWMNTPTTLKIRVLPSLFDAWYAWTIYFIIFCTLLYFIYLYFIHKFRFNEGLRIAEIEKKNTEELAQIKLRFFTNISHELLTPLTVMECIVEDVRKNKRISKEQETIMSNNITRLIHLIRQILEFRKAESENLKLKIGYDDIAASIKAICKVNFKPLTEKKKIHFSVLSTPESIVGWFDADKIEKIVYNLLSNACKYNVEDGFIQITLNEEFVEGTRVLQLVVKDNGIGIAEEKIPFIFKRFYDGDYRRQKVTGTGIGLSLTKSLVDLHKGTIEVESKLNQGTKFTIHIPIDKTSYENVDVEISENKNTAESEVNDEEMLNDVETTKNVVLLVDDNQELLSVVSKFLSEDYHVLQAENGLAAIEILKTNHVDLVATDVMMPELDGFELCKFVKANIETSHIPVLLLTVKSQEEDRSLGYESGADGYLTKPFKPSLLKSRIKSLFKNNEMLIKRFKKQEVLTVKELNYKSLDEKFISKAIAIIEDNLTDSDFNFDSFVDEMNVTRSTLYRKIKSMTGMTTSDFVKSIRLKKSCSILQKSKANNISEVAYAVGFNDPKYFSKCFKKEFGVLPAEYAKSFSQKEE